MKYIFAVIFIIILSACSIFESDQDIDVEYYFFENSGKLTIYSIVKDLEVERFGSIDSLVKSNLEIKTGNKYLVQGNLDTTLYYRHSNLISFVQIKTIDLDNYTFDSTETFSFEFETIEGLVYNFRSNITNMLNMKNESTLVLIPGVKANHGVGAEFKMFALRLKEKEEYLPSSEELYVEIYNSQGVILHKSSAGISHTTALEDVKPVKVGDYYEYRYDWFLDEMMMPRNNTYGAKMIIPAKKDPYIRQIEFNWENNGL